MEDLKFDLQLFAEEAESDVDTTTEQPDTEQDSNVDDSQDYDWKVDGDGNVTFDEHAFDDMMQYSDSEDDGDVQPEAPEEEHTEAPQQQTYTVTVDGVEQQVSMDELLKGYMRQSDYTKKTQALADQRRQFEQAQQQPKPQPAQQAQQPQVTPEQQKQNVEDYYTKLANYAKRSVEQRLGREYDEYNPVDQVALADEVATIKAAVYERDKSQRDFQAVYNKYAKDPNYREIDQFASQKLQELPYRDAVRIQSALQNYDIRTIDKYMELCRDEYYRSRGYVPASEVAQPKAQPPKQAKPKVSPPYVESTGVKRDTKNIKPVPDYSKLGKLTLEQQAQVASKFNLA